MDERKAIICLSCGKRFLVEREDYKERKEEGLCDKCLADIEENDRPADFTRDLGRAVGRFLDGINGMLGERKQNNATEENDCE